MNNTELRVFVSGDEDEDLDLRIRSRPYSSDTSDNSSEAEASDQTEAAGCDRANLKSGNELVEGFDWGGDEFARAGEYKTCIRSGQTCSVMGGPLGRGGEPGDDKRGDPAGDPKGEPGANDNG